MFSSLWDHNVPQNHFSDNNSTGNCDRLVISSWILNSCNLTGCWKCFWSCHWRTAEWLKYIERSSRKCFFPPYYWNFHKLQKELQLFCACKSQTGFCVIDGVLNWLNYFMVVFVCMLNLDATLKAIQTWCCSLWIKTFF